MRLNNVLLERYTDRKIGWAHEGVVRTLPIEHALVLRWLKTPDGVR